MFGGGGLTKVGMGVRAMVDVEGDGELEDIVSVDVDTVFAFEVAERLRVSSPDPGAAAGGNMLGPPAS